MVLMWNVWVVILNMFLSVELSVCSPLLCEGKCKYFVNILLKLEIITWNVKHGGDKCEYVFHMYTLLVYAINKILLNILFV